MRKIATLLVALTLAGSTPALAQVCELVPLDTAASAGFLSRPVVLDSTAYAPGGSTGIVRFDIGDPEDLVVLGTHATQGEATAVSLDFFARRLVVADGSAGVGTYAIDSSGAPVHEGTLDLGQTMVSITGSGSQWLAGSSSGTVYTLARDIGLTMEGSLETGGQVLGIVTQSTRSYCALGSAGLALVDTADRAHPVLKTLVDLGGTVVSVERAGTLLFCGVEGIGVVSVQIDGESLIPVGTTPLDEAPQDIVHWGGRLYLAGPSMGFLVADASLGSDLLVLAALELDGANGVALVGNTIYVSRGDNGFSSVDTTDCANSGVLATTRFIPAAARAVGTENTYWVSDIAVTNLTGNVATFNMAYLVKNQANPVPDNRSVVLEPGQQMLLADVFETLFELEDANGALRITGSHPDVRTTSRTYNAAGLEGTYGQFIPALPRTEALEAGVVGSLLQLQQNDAFRTNIGLLNITATTVEVQIDLYVGDGTLVGVRNETLLPFEMAQIDRIFVTVGADPVDSGFAVITVTSEGQVLAYASVVDNGSGDPIYIPSQILTLDTPFQPGW